MGSEGVGSLWAVKGSGHCGQRRGQVTVGSEGVGSLWAVKGSGHCGQ